jgi:hypothetical protein
MTPHEINDKDNFIMAWRFEDTSFCEPMIDYYNSKTPNKGGTIAADANSPTGSSLKINLAFKDSFDVCVKGDIDAPQYFATLQACLNEYIKKYKYCDEFQPFKIVENFNIQKYLPNGAFHAWHCERGGHDNMTNSRHLVFMTYLNDVTDAGETEFFYQKLKIKPEKGLTVIWPSDWTFTHRGVPSPTQEKMIVTGWLNYVVPGLQGA